jgi:hypothetical protein
MYNISPATRLLKAYDRCNHGVLNEVPLFESLPVGET